MTDHDPHPWSPKDDHDLQNAIEHDNPGLLAIGIAMVAGLAAVAVTLLAGLIYGGIALWGWLAHLLT